MSTARSLQQLEALTNHYLQELEGFSIEELRRQPSDEEWSLGQMYLHLINASSNLYLRNIQTCMTTMPSAEGSAEKTEAGQTDKVRGISHIQLTPNPVPSMVRD
jgi:hypothetical protein